MDWLLERQETIEKRLAKRHLSAGGLVLFDLTSSQPGPIPSSNTRSISWPQSLCSQNRSHHTNLKQLKRQQNHGQLNRNFGLGVP